MKSDKIQIMERWKTIPRYPNYEASTFGRIRRHVNSTSYKKTFPGKILKQWPQESGYMNVHLMKNGKVCQERTHRLVLETFKGECPDGFEGDHADNINSNNKIYNLYWKSTSKNRSNPGEKNGSATHTEKQAIQVRWLTRLNFTCREIAKIVNCSVHLVGRIRYKYKWKHA